MSGDNYSDNTTYDFSQIPSPFAHPSPELPGYIFDYAKSSQSMEDFSNFAATQVPPSSSAGFGNPFSQPTIPRASEPQVQSDYFGPLEDPTSGYEVHASSMPMDLNTSTQTSTSSYQSHFLYGPHPTAQLPVTNIRSNSFGSVSSDGFMPHTGGYDLPGLRSQCHPMHDIVSDTMGQGYSSSDFCVLPTPATPYTEQLYSSGDHFAGDQLGCPHESPCEECTEDQCAYLRFKNDEPFADWAFDHDSTVNSPQSNEAPIPISPTPAAVFMGVPRGEHQANINSADPSSLQGPQGRRRGEAQKLDSVHTPVDGTGSVLTDPLAPQYKCCRFMRKNELPEGPLPGEEETEAWLRAEEFDAIPPDIPLTLADLVSRVPGKDLFARKWCILAIWSNQHRALTTEGVLEVLIKMVKRFGDDAEAAIPKGPNKKRTGWAATMVSALSTETIFVQKSQDGGRSCEWRLDVRGEKFHSKRTKCRHGGHQASNSPRNDSG